ncbi:hypothetical protein BSKO_08597 [Bryopsis sp. KO-2023]|nr:hypothetical protein BSKO_08597 [Bryopsis sp. KO-2023]
MMEFHVIILTAYDSCCLTIPVHNANTQPSKMVIHTQTQSIAALPQTFTTSNRSRTSTRNLLRRQTTCSNDSNPISRRTSGEVNRRLALAGLASLELLRSQTRPALADDPYADPSRYYKTPSGIRVQELAGGKGREAQLGDVVEFDYVCRRQNGYFIYATVEGVSFQPLDTPTGPVRFKLGDESLITGVTEILTGIRAGAKLRAEIPPQVGYVTADMEPSPPTYAAKRQILNHRKENLLFEIKVLKVKQAMA